MKNIRVLGLFAICLFVALESLGQTDIYLSPVAPFRGLRTGTFSNRTTDGYNKGNGSPKTWTFFDNTSWNSKFYNGDITKPAYTEGHSIIWGGDFDKNYRLLFPVGYNLPQNAGYKYPLILFVHGAGERGNCWGSGNSFYNTSSTSGSGGAISASTPTILTRSSGSFSSADLYKNILINNAGPSGGVLITYITAVNSSTSVTLATAATTFGTGKSFNYGYGRTGTGSMPANSNILTSPTPIFNPNDVNTTIQVSNGFNWCFPNPFFPNNPSGVTTIASYISSTQVTLATPNGATALNNVQVKFGLGTNPAFLGNDLSLVHAGNEHLQAVYTANGKLAEDPTLPTRGFPGFVVVPQNEDGSTYVASTFNDVIDLLIAQYNIDPDRIYVHGLSNGGGTSWRITNLRPELYAAVLPMSGVISAGDPMFNSPAIDRIVPIPSWSFQGGTDGEPTPNNTNQIQDKLKVAGATPRFKLYPTVGHGTWGFAYAEPDFFSWMLKQNKRNITVLYGDSTLCPTDNSGVKLALSTGFLAYQWELDGAIMSTVPLTSSTITVTQPGTYRARFSRLSANPNTSQWNAWSKPVVIRETAATSPVITALGTSHLPDINGGTIVRINGPTKKDITKNWYVNGTLSTTNPLISYPPPASPTNNLDSTNYTRRNTAGVVTLKTLALDACSSLVSNSIYVTVGVTPTLVAPASPIAIATSANSVQLFWTDNTPNETGFEINRSTTGLAGSYTFFKLVNAGTISYTDTGLSPGATYYYQLRAVNNTDKSNYTGNVVVSTLGDIQPPTAPQNLVSGLKTLTSINLSWTASSDNTGILQYQISYNGATSGTINTSSTATTYNVTGLTGNTNYTFTVKAIDLANNASQPSNQIVTSTIFSGLNYTYSAVNVDLLTDAGNNWNTPELTGTCTNFDIALRKQDDYFNFKFEGYISLPAGDYNFRSQSDDGSMVFMGAEGASDFPFDPGDPIVAANFLNNRVFDNDGLHGCGPAGATPSTINFSGNAARPITVIMFEKTGGECLVVEYKLASSSTWLTVPNSVLNSGTPPVLTPPAMPTGISAVSSGMNSIDLNWTASVGATSYEVYQSLDDINYSIIASVSTNTFTITSLLPNTKYYYKLKSVSDTNGSSGLTSSVNATTAPDSAPPTIPTGVTILSINYTGVGIQWTASTDNVGVTGYKIYANGVLLGTSPTVTYSSTALLPGTNYNITVSAYDASLNTSLESTAANFTTSGAVTFYSKPASDLSLTSSWGTNTNGTGTPPPSFAYDGQLFKIPSPQTQILTNPLTIGGTVSRVIVDDGATLTISQPLTGTLKVGSGSTLNVNVDYQPVFETIDPTSTINFNTYSTVPIATYGNLNLTGSGLKSVAAGTLEVLGNLTLASGIGIKGAASNGTTVKVAKDLITGSSVATVSSDNRVTLQFSGTTPQNLTVSTDQAFYKISTTSTANVTFNASAKTLSLGSTNGGGLDLATGSTLVLGNNNLTLTDKAEVNPTNATGEISINNANISLTTSATTPANFYFNSVNNKVQKFTLQSTTGGATFIRKGMGIYDGLKINNGVLNAGGFITLKSSDTASAAIQQIVSGSITGNVNVERYIAPKRVYRYLSSPVAGAKVADWQNYFPITGAFTGSSPQSTNASMFYYNEPAPTATHYVAYPVASNQETLQVGLGYATFMRESVNPITLMSTGVPNQGTIPFSLTGVNVVTAPTGFNLVGNPYASDIVWNNTAWASANVSNIISIRENNYDGNGNSRVLYWDRSLNTGTLPNGKIPAGQAFWVQATTAAPSLSVTEAAKTTDPASGNTNFFRSEPTVSKSLFTLKLSNGTLQDYAFVNLTDEGSDLYDKVRDGAKRPNSFFNLSTASIDSASVSLAINDASNSFCEKTIAVNLEPGENLTKVAPGNYTLQFENLENFSYASIQLVDAFLGTTTSIDKNSAPYILAVTADVASYTNRLSIKLTRPGIVTNNLLTATKDNYCSSDENVVLTINNSQAGVTYEALNANAASISQKVIGTGDNISLTIPVKNLVANQNTIRVQSNFAGCSAVLLANTKVITVNDLPSISTQLEVSGCIGSSLTLTANGTGKTYQWVDQNLNQTLSETSNTIQVVTLNPFNSYKVTAISDKGCQSESKNILVRADTLDTPKITLTTNGVFQTDATRNVQWLLNGTVLAGANTNSYSPTQSGFYSVKTQNTFCTKESPATEYLVTGFENGGNHSFSLTVFPNPSETGEITVIGNSSLSNELQIQITDVIGRELVTKSVSAEEFKKGSAIETSWAKGIYIVRVTQDNLNLHQKIIIR